MWYEKEPPGFNPLAEVSGCFIEHDGELLLLKRLGAYAGTEALPGGVVDEGETPLEAVIREVSEETGIDLSDTPPDFLKTIFERWSDKDFVYHMFHAALTERQIVALSSEHSDFSWVTPALALQRNLIEDLDACIKMFYPQAAGE